MSPPGFTKRIVGHIKLHLKILEEAFGFSKGEITPVLGALDPRPNQSWMKLGNEVAHRFSVAKAKFLASICLVSTTRALITLPQNMATFPTRLRGFERK